MSDQDTQKTQPSLTTTEIMTIILGCEQTLRFVQASPNYKQIEASERFSTSNDLKMGDAVQALMEIHEAILNIEFYSQGKKNMIVGSCAYLVFHKTFHETVSTVSSMFQPHNNRETV